MNPVVKKLGLKPATRALVLSAPPGYLKSLTPLPQGIALSETIAGAYEFIQFFATKKSEIEQSARKLLQSAAPGALVWITYPKKTSGVDSDLGREAVWTAMEGTGWRPVSQIAIDEVWSALRFRPLETLRNGEVSVTSSTPKSSHWKLSCLTLPALIVDIETKLSYRSSRTGSPNGSDREPRTGN